MIRLANVLKISLQDVLKMSWRCLENVFEEVFKTFWRRLEDVLARRLEDVIKTPWLKTSWRCLEDIFTRRFEDVLKTSCRRLENVLKTSWRHMAKTNILTKTSWRRLEDVFWRRKAKANIFVLIKTSSEDEDERCLHNVFIKTNVCWDRSWRQNRW